MAKPSNFERGQAEISPIRDRLATLATSYHGLSSEYGLTTLRSAFVVNGGALLAMPAYVATVQGAVDGTNTLLIVLSASAFICGIVLTALSCFCAYLNFQYHALFHQCKAEIEITNIEETYDDVSFHRSQGQRKYSRDHYRKHMDKYEKRVKVHLWGSLVLGFASYGAFCVGCYFSGRLLLSETLVHPL